MSARQAGAVRAIASHPARASGPVVAAELDSAQQTITETCVGCHSDRGKAGGLSLQGYAVAAAGEHLETTEKMIRKLRAGQMPPAGSRRPDDAVLDALADARDPGRRPRRRRPLRAAARSSA